MRLEKGQIVMVYQDPITCQTKEGKAKLIRNLNQNHPKQEYWQVEFLEDNYRCPRWINTNLQKHRVPICCYCDEGEVEHWGDYCKECIDYMERLKPDNLTEEEKIELIAAQAESHYQYYKNM